MANYTKELQEMLQRVAGRGNPNAQDIQKICSVVFRMNDRINQLEEQVVLDDKPAAKVTKPKSTPKAKPQAAPEVEEETDTEE
jgi:hypothetical protein